MENNEHQIELTHQSLSVLTPDCIKSFIDNLNSGSEADLLEPRKINLNQSLKNIKNHIINTPSSIQAESLSTILETIKEIFLTASSEPVYYKLSEICFLIDCFLPDSQLDSHNLALSSILDMTNHSFFFNTLLICIENYYKKIAGFEDYTTSDTTEDLTITFYSTSIEILIKNSESRYQKCKVFIMKNLDVLKAVFFTYLQDRSVLTQKKMERVLGLVLDLLRIYVKEPEMNSFASVFIISVLSEITGDWKSYLDFSSVLVRFLIDTVTKENFNELLCLSPLFSEPFIVSLSNPEFQENWFRLWDSVYHIIPKTEIFVTLSQKFCRMVNRTYQQGLNIFFKKCENGYKDVIEFVSKSAYIEKILNKVYSRVSKTRTVAIYLDTIELVIRCTVDEKTFKLFLNEKLLGSETCQKKIFRIVKETLGNDVEGQVSDFIGFLQEAKSLSAVRFLMNSLADKGFKDITGRLLKKGLTSVLINVLKKDFELPKREDLVDLWQAFFTIYFICDYEKKNIPSNFVVQVITALRSAKYEALRQEVIEQAIETLEKILRFKSISAKKFSLICFDLVSYPYISEKILNFRSDVLKSMKLSKMGYDKVDLIISIILFHLKKQISNGLYRKLLKKGLDYNASPGNVAHLLSLALDSRSEVFEFILGLVREIVVSKQPSLKFWHFPGTGGEVYNLNGNIKLSNKLTVCFRVKPSKNPHESILFELQDDQFLNLTVSVLLNKVSVHIKQGKTEYSLLSNTEIVQSSFNFISVSILGGKSSLISLKVNKKILCKAVENLKFMSKIKKFSIAGSLAKTQPFAGKLSGLLILKDFLHEDSLQVLSGNFYFDLTDEFKALRERAVFLLSPVFKAQIGTFDPEERKSYCFRGKTLAKNFKYASCVLFKLVTSELSWKAMDYLLEIFIVLGESRDNSVKSIVETLFAYSMLYPANYPNCMELITTTTDLKLKKKIFKFFLLNDLNPPFPQNFFSTVLKEYNRVFRFTALNFLVLRNLASRMTGPEICEHFSVFSEQFTEYYTTSEILATLIQLKDFSFAEEILSVLVNVDFKECPETLFRVFMYILVFPQLNKGPTLICVIIFNHFLKANSLKRDSIKSNSSELNKYLYNIKDKISEVEPVLDAVLYLASKNVGFTEKSTVLALFELVLSQVPTLKPDLFPKFFNFLQYFVKYFNSAILKNRYFLLCFTFLSECFQVKAGEILVYIYSKLEKFKTFSKIVEFFRIIKNKSFGFHVFASLFSVLIKSRFIENGSLLAELMTILSFFFISKENSEAYCEIVLKFASIIENNPRLLRFTAVLNESEMEVNESFVGNIFFTVAFQVFYSKASVLFENCKKIVQMPEVEFFSKLRLDKVSEDYSVLFCFTRISNLVILGNPDFSEFLERFKGKTRVLDRIEEFFLNLSEAKVADTCLVNVQDEELGSQLMFDKEKTLELLSKSRSGNLSEVIVTEEWVRLVHNLLQVLIISPFDALLSTKKTTWPSGTYNRGSRASSLDYQSILFQYGKQENHLINLEHSKQLIRKLKKSQKFDFDEDPKKLTFAVANYHDPLFRSSKVKMTKKPDSETETRRKQYRHSIIRSKSTIDFSSLVVTEQGNSSVLLENKESLHKNESFVYDCEQITVKGSFFGKISIFSHFLQLKFEDTLKPSTKGGALEFTMRKKRSVLIIASNEIFEILTRKFIHRNTAIEVFLFSGKSYFINFFEESVQSDALNLVKKWKKVHVCEDPTEILQGLRKKWTERQISNFHYLILLNKYSGRSFKDISQYPVFPWVIIEFSSSELDLNNPEVFRNFNYPIAAQTQAQRTDLSQRARYKNYSTFDDYQNGSHYSNGGIVLYYLFRIEPFTQQAKILHDGDFDSPDRIFFSMTGCWNSCISLNDSKELVPEFFYLSEVLMNLNGLDSGRNFLGENSAGFEVPRWAKSPWDFVRKHRKALESVICSGELHKWIDLVFGYKQRGPLARENFNLFMRVTYDDLFQEEKKSVQDNIEGITDQIYHFGQTPRQVFLQAHPKKKQLQPEDFTQKLSNNTQSEWKFQIPKNTEVLNLLILQDFLIIFYKSDPRLQFSRHKISKKISEKGKNFILKGVALHTSSSNIQFSGWKSLIVSYGYIDYKIRIHDSNGEFQTLISTSSIQPSAVLGKTNLFYADFNIVISIKASWSIEQKYYGHLEQVVGVSVSEDFSILCSVSESGVVFIHDLKTAEIIQKFCSEFRSVHASEYGAIVGVTDKGYSLVSFSGIFGQFVEIGEFGKYAVTSSGEYLVYSGLGGLCCRDVFDDSEKVVKSSSASFVAVGETNRYLVFLGVSAKEVVVIS